MNQKGLAQEIGVSETVVSRILKINKLPEGIRKEIPDYPEIPKSVLAEIASVKKEEEQVALWESIKSGQIGKRSEVREKKREEKISRSESRDQETERIWRLWKIVKKVVKENPDAVKKLVNVAKLETDVIWEAVERAVKKDRSIIQIVIKLDQLEKIVEEAKE